MAQPKYLSIKHYLLELILSGAVSPGQRLPSEHWLLEHFSASRPTVRRAVDELVTDGLLRRRKGSGTFVSTSPKDLLSRNSNASGRVSPSSEVLLQHPVKGSLAISELLRLPANRQLLLVTTLHMLDGTPVAHEQRFALARKSRAGYASERPDLPIAAMRLASIEKVTSAISVGGYLAKFLEVEDSQPCLCIEWSTQLRDARISLLRTIYASPLTDKYAGHSGNRAKPGVRVTTATL